MSIKEELHDLVERLSEDEAASILALVRDQPSIGAYANAPVSLSQRAGLSVVPGHIFLNTPRKTIDQLVAEQRVKPFAGRESIPEDVFPDDEIDEFVKAVRQWRNEG